MSPAIFDPNRVKGTARGTGNIIYLQNLWLDFENGDLSPDEFPKLFPRTRMILTNTFRHTVARPRYRVIIPTTDQLTPETYLLLYEQIARKLEDAGYAVPRRKPKAGLRCQAPVGTRLVKTAAYQPVLSSFTSCGSEPKLLPRLQRRIKGTA